MHIIGVYLSTNMNIEHILHCKSIRQMDSIILKGPHLKELSLLYDYTHNHSKIELYPYIKSPKISPAF